MELLDKRREYIKQVVMLARDSYNITTAFSVGASALEPTDIRLLFVPSEGADPVATYKNLNYLLSKDMKPKSAETLSRDPECIAKKYALDGGFVLTVYISGVRTAESMGWWRPLYDSARLVEAMDPSNRVSEDRLAQDAEDDLPEIDPEPEAAVAAPVPMIIPDPEPEPEPEPEAEAEPEYDAPAASGEQAEIDEAEEYWDFVSAQMRSARHAISAESFIRANEILNVLRKMLIELICVRNGVESDFDTSIDYIECEEKDMLIKTYPAGMNKPSFITALANITALFDRLG